MLYSPPRPLIVQPAFGVGIYSLKENRERAAKSIAEVPVHSGDDLMSVCSTVTTAFPRIIAVYDAHLLSSRLPPVDPATCFDGDQVVAFRLWRPPGATWGTTPVGALGPTGVGWKLGG